MRLIRLTVAALMLFAAASAGAAAHLAYTDVLKQLTDLDRLTRPHVGYRAGLFSSWDRAGLTVWGANGDAGQYLRVEPDGEAVMVDVDGPGCIYRIWSANPQGNIRVYLDGDTKPTYEWPFDRIFTGDIPPFVKPLVYQRDGAQSASDAYLPIPFARHIKITADRKYGQYYQFNYLLFPKDQPVASFRLPLEPAAQAALDAAVDVWAHPGRDPKPALAGQRTERRSFTIRPHETVGLADLRGPGIIRAIRVSATSQQRYLWRKLVLSGAWDGAAWPQVLTPLGPLFGFDWQAPEYGSVIAGCQGGRCYFYYPMPFRRSGRLHLTSHLEQPARVSVEIDWAPVQTLPADTLYFFARWRSEPDSTTFDYPFVETAGHGQFVGVAMPIDHPLPGWWGEGDEKVWVDDDLYPPWIGTGSEDYFGDAWGIRYLPGPSFGASAMEGHRTCNYRWHFMDFIPFEQRFRMTIENYGPNGAGPRGQYEYTSTAMWYQAELEPPFWMLKNAVYIGGDDPGQKPAAYLWHPDLFTSLDDAALRTYGLGLTFAVEAESFAADAVRRGRAKIITDAKRRYEFSRERAVDFGKARPGRILAEVPAGAVADGVSFPTIYTAPEPGLAQVTLEVDGKRLDVTGRTDAGAIQLSGIYLPKDRRAMRVVAATGGRVVVDAVRFDRAQREPGAIEAEEAVVVRTVGGAPQPEAGPPTRAASAGRYLLLRPTQPGSGAVLRIPAASPLPYSLGVRPMLGPRAGVLQAYVDGKPVGPPYDLYDPATKRGDAILPLGPMPANGEIEIRAVGKNPQSQGYDLGLDYFRFEPQILGPGSAWGVAARVLAVRGAEYRIQDLGPAFYGGHQLWVQPSSRGAAVDVGIETPQDGDYEIVVRYASSWDYAIVQASLDGKPLGSPVDCYSAEVVPMAPVSLGTMHLAAGQHVLSFQAVDKNAKSQGYLMGINYIAVRGGP